jgi:hypothetical protein
MSVEDEADRPERPRKAPRVRRTAAAVIAQYIKDLTRPPGPGPLAPA